MGTSGGQAGQCTALAGNETTDRRLLLLEGTVADLVCSAVAPRKLREFLWLGTVAITGSAMQMLLCTLFRISSVKHALN